MLVNVNAKTVAYVLQQCGIQIPASRLVLNSTRCLLIVTERDFLGGVTLDYGRTS